MRHRRNAIARKRANLGPFPKVKDLPEPDQLPAAKPKPKKARAKRKKKARKK